MPSGACPALAGNGEAFGWQHRRGGQSWECRPIAREGGDGGGPRVVFFGQTKNVAGMGKGLQTKSLATFEFPGRA